jgi:protein CpxP
MFNWKRNRKSIALGACGAMAIAACTMPLLSQSPAMAQDFGEPLFAQGFDGPGPRGPRDGGKLLEELNLSDAQLQQMQEIRERGRTQSEPTRNQLQQAQEQLKNLMTGNASESAIRTQFQQVQSLRQQLASMHFDHMLEMRNVLTPAQRQEFAQLMEQRREQWGNRRDRGDRPGRRGNRPGLGNQ